MWACVCPFSIFHEVSFFPLCLLTCTDYMEQWIYSATLYTRLLQWKARVTAIRYPPLSLSFSPQRKRYICSLSFFSLFVPPKELHRQSDYISSLQRTRTHIRLDAVSRTLMNRTQQQTNKGKQNAQFPFNRFLDLLFLRTSTNIMRYLTTVLFFFLTSASMSNVLTANSVLLPLSCFLLPGYETLPCATT